MSSLAIPSTHNLSPVTQSLHQEGQQFVSSTKKVADEIISSNSNQSSSSSDSCCHASYRYSFWSPYYFWSPIYVDPYPGYYGRRDDDDGALRFLIGLVAAVAGGIAMYTVGAKVNAIMEADEELSEIQKSKYKFRNLANHGTHQDFLYSKKLTQLADLREGVFKRVKNNAIADLILTIGVVAGSALALTGAFFTGYQMINTGIVIGLVSCAAILFKWGLDSTSKQNERDANAIYSAARDINT